MRPRGDRKRRSRKSLEARDERRQVMQRLTTVEDRVVALLNSSSTYVNFFVQRIHDLRTSLATEDRLGTLVPRIKERFEEQIRSFERGGERMERARTDLRQYLGTVRLLRETLLPEGLDRLVSSIGQLKEMTHRFSTIYGTEDFHSTLGGTPWSEMEIQVNHLNGELDGLEVVLRDWMQAFQE